jgi:hypothetical protein
VKAQVKSKTLFFRDEFFQRGLTDDLRPHMERLLSDLQKTGRLDEDYYRDILLRAASNMGREVVESDVTWLEAGDEVEISPAVPQNLAPPRFAATFAILMTAKSDHAEALLGDLDELFHADCERIGSDRAAWRYRARVLKSALPLLRKAIGRMIRWGGHTDNSQTYLHRLNLSRSVSAF